MVNLVIRANVAIGIFPTGGLQWPYQVTPYLSALPGLAGFGMDISAGDLPTKCYFITSLADTDSGAANPARGPNCFDGTARWCWQRDQGVGFHKLIFPLVSGYCYIGRRVTGPQVDFPVGRGNCDYVGQAAPGPGFIWRCCGLRFGGGRNMRAWHLASWLGDEPSASGVTNFKADTRDCFGWSGVDNSPADLGPYDNGDTAGINCETRFSMDEAAELGYYSSERNSWLRGAVYDPLHAPPGFGMPPGSHHEEGQDHGYGMLIGGARFPSPNPPTDPDPIPTRFQDHTLIQQSLFAHTTDRNPTTSSLNIAHVNNLHYNHGRPGDGRGAGFHIFDNFDVNQKAGKTQQCNVVGCMTVMGPNQMSTQTQLPTLVSGCASASPGSTGHGNHNTQFGWVPVASQGDFFYNDPVGYFKSTLISSAWPSGFGSNYSGVLRPFNNVLSPTQNEGLAFSDLFRRTIGMKPAKRHLYAGGLHRIFNQIDDKIRGIPGSNEFVNTVGEAGGWPVMPNLTVDPANPGTEYWAPMPLSATRDDLVPFGGTLIDGSSSDGMSYIRRWMANQHHYSMGLTVPTE